MESVKTQSESRKLIFVLCYGLIGGGKSSIFNLIKEIIQRDEKLKIKINLLYLSSDKIKAEKITEYRMTHQCSFQEAHDKVNMKAKDAFNKNIISLLKKYFDCNKINLFLVDKMFFPNTLNDFHQ